MEADRVASVQKDDEDRRKRRDELVEHGKFNIT